MKGETDIPRPSRPFEHPVTLAIRNGRATVAPDPSLLTARADVAEADTSEAVAADPSVIDAERDPLYGDRVQDAPSVAGSSPARVRRSHGEPVTADGKGVRDAQSAETKTLGRLSRWQEQR